MRALRPAEGGLLWRTAKADVAHELALPPQSERTTLLQLSAIERHFYMRQHQVWRSSAPADTLPHRVLHGLNIVIRLVFIVFTRKTCLYAPLIHREHGYKLQPLTPPGVSLQVGRSVTADSAA